MCARLAVNNIYISVEEKKRNNRLLYQTSDHFAIEALTKPNHVESSWGCSGKNCAIPFDFPEKFIQFKNLLFECHQVTLN